MKADVLDRALGEADVVIRSWAFASGSALWNETGVDWIRLATEDTYAPIRWRAFDALLRREVSPEQVSAFLFDSCTGIRCACQAVFTHRFGLNPVQTYREALVGANSKRSEVTARGLGETGTPEDGPRLQALLNHASARVRSAAIHALGVLNVEQIDARLLELVSSDRRSVAREAASVLLSRKAVNPTVIWAAAKRNPNEHVQLAVLRQMWRSSKWVQLRLYLDSLEAGSAELSECAIERLKVWECQFNRTFIQPSQGELSELRDLLQTTQSHLPADLGKRVAFIVESF
jgi:HEAT repeat protein